MREKERERAQQTCDHNGLKQKSVRESAIRRSITCHKWQSLHRCILNDYFWCYLQVIMSSSSSHVDTWWTVLKWTWSHDCTIIHAHYQESSDVNNYRRLKLQSAFCTTSFASNPINSVLFISLVFLLLVIEIRWLNGSCCFEQIGKMFLVTVLILPL